MFGSGSSDKKQNIAVVNRISDNKNTGKVSLISNENSFSTKDDIEWNNENVLKGGRGKVEEKDCRDLSKRSKEHFQDPTNSTDPIRQSEGDGHAFAYSSSIIQDYADWEVKDYLGKPLSN